ncbi:MAG: MarR family transcriptional regulator [Actinomycetota bacterium]
MPPREDAVDALLSASRALVGLAARSLASVHEVTLPQFRALVVLEVTGSLTVSELAERLGIHPSTATRLCDRLVAKDLISRFERSGDRRGVDIVLAGPGRRLVEEVTDRRRRDLAAIAGRMSEPELRQAISALNAFARAAGEVPDASLFGWPDPVPPLEPGR